INRAAPYGQEVSAEAHRRNYERQLDRNRNDNRDDGRIDDRREAVARQRAQEQAYRDYLAQRQRVAYQHSLDLQRAHRLAQYRYQQQYYQSLPDMQRADARDKCDDEPAFSS